MASKHLVSIAGLLAALGLAGCAYGAGGYDGYVAYGGGYNGYAAYGGGYGAPYYGES